MIGLASSGVWEFKLFKLRHDSIVTPEPLGRKKFESQLEEFVDEDPLLAMGHQQLCIRPVSESEQWGLKLVSS
jgi:hypothetical protein